MDEHVTAVVIAVEDDLKDIEGLGHLTSSADFNSDLQFFGTNWFYHASTGRRGLIALAKKHTVSDFRGLAAKVASALQSKKIKDTHFIFSSSITNLEELAGHFINNFENKNYESDCKRPLDVKEGEDPRKTRHLSNVENYQV